MQTRLILILIAGQCRPICVYSEVNPTELNETCSQVSGVYDCRLNDAMPWHLGSALGTYAH